jgi:ParB/RepB/Spo0J family partition protein
MAIPLVDQVRPGLKHVALTEIHPNPRNPRQRFDEAALAELVESVRAQGVIEPLVLTPAENGIGGYLVVAGERRRRAATEAGLTWVPAVIREMDERQQMEVMLCENLIRADLDPVEEARGIRRLLDECDMTQEQLAKRLGKSQPWIANRLRLLRLPETVLKALEEGKLSPGHAQVLLQYEAAPKTLEAAAAKIIKHKIPVADVGGKALQASMDKTECRSLSPYDAKFDLAPCKGCEHDRTPGWQRYCLNPACWEDKQAAGIAAAQAKLGETEGLPTIADLEAAGKKVARGANDEDCLTCPDRVLAKMSYGEPQHVCTRRQCFDAKLEEQAKINRAAAQAEVDAGLREYAAAGEKASAGLEAEHLALLLTVSLLSHAGGRWAGNDVRWPDRAQFVKDFLGLTWPKVEGWYDIRQEPAASQIRTFADSLLYLPVSQLRSALVQWTLIGNHKDLGPLPGLLSDDSESDPEAAK